MPSSLLYCQELRYMQLLGFRLAMPSTFKGLQALTLENCSLEISPAFEGFLTLTDLSLKDIAIVDQNRGDLSV